MIQKYINWPPPPGPSLVGWKVVMIIGAHSWEGPTGWGQPKKSSGQLTGHCCASSRKLIICTCLSLANLNIQKSLKHSNKRRGKAQMSTRTSCSDSKTEPSSPSRPPAPERSNTNRSLNMQTEKDVWEPNSAPARVFCRHRARRETRLKAHQHQICLFLLLNQHIQNYVKIPFLESILGKNCRLCLKWK